MEQTESKTYIHNPFETKVCPKCGHKYDAVQPKCPKCKEPFETSRALPFNEVTFVNPFIEIALFFVGWLGLKGLVEIISRILRDTVINGSLPASEANMVLNYAVYGTLFIIMMGIVAIYLPKLCKSFTKPDFLWGFIVYAVIFGFDIVWGNISRAIGATINENQDAINNIAKINVPLSILFLGFLGPICEELTYRVGLFNFTRRVNRIMGYVISAAIFGLIHIHDYASLNEWLSYPSYLFAGLAFAFAYEKWGFGASTLAHVTNNVLSLLIVAMVQQ